MRARHGWVLLACVAGLLAAVLFVRQGKAPDSGGEERDPASRSEAPSRGETPRDVPEDKAESGESDRATSAARARIGVLKSFSARLADEDEVITALIGLHRGLLARSTRTATLEEIERAWGTAPALVKVLFTFLVGGFEDEEIKAFRMRGFQEPDSRVVAFAARMHLMTEVTEEEPAIRDGEERLRQLLDGEAVRGFNAKDYAFFWECALYEIGTEFRSSFPLPACIERFEAKYFTNPVLDMAPEVRVYNDCFHTELRDETIRRRLVSRLASVPPGEAKSRLLGIMLYRKDARIPLDMIDLCHSMIMNPTEDGWYRYRSVRSFRLYHPENHVDTFRAALPLEMSQARPYFALLVEAYRGLLAGSPQELSTNVETRRLTLDLITTLALDDKHRGELTFIVPPALKTGDAAIVSEIERIADSVEGSAPAGAAYLKKLLRKSESR